MMRHPFFWSMHPFAALLIGALVVVPVWRLCARLGFAGAWSLLTLVPILNFALLYYLAFAEWPIERHSAAPPSAPA